MTGSWKPEASIAPPTGRSQVKGVVVGVKIPSGVEETAVPRQWNLGSLAQVAAKYITKLFGAFDNRSVVSSGFNCWRLCRAETYCLNDAWSPDVTSVL